MTDTPDDETKVEVPPEPEKPLDSKTLAEIVSRTLAEASRPLMERIDTLESRIREPKPQSAAPEAGLGDLIYTDPEAYSRRIVDMAVEKAVNQVTGQYTAQQSAQTWLAEFYRKNPDLEGADDILNAVYQRANPRIDLRSPDAMDRLAEAARAYLTRFVGRSRESSEDRTFTESSGSRGKPRIVKPEAEESVIPLGQTLAEALRRRQSRS